jgi:hypothetical protein
MPRCRSKPPRERFSPWDGFNGTAGIYPEAATDLDLHRREAGAMFADVPSCPQWRGATYHSQL